MDMSFNFQFGNKKFCNFFLKKKREKKNFCQTHEERIQCRNFLMVSASSNFHSYKQRTNPTDQTHQTPNLLMNTQMHKSNSTHSWIAKQQSIITRIGSNNMKQQLSDYRTSAGFTNLATPWKSKAATCFWVFRWKEITNWKKKIHLYFQCV
jgi:hypothetical protein